jgi:hypothetical protein
MLTIHTCLAPRLSWVELYLYHLCVSDGMLRAVFYLFFNLYTFADMGNINLPNVQKFPTNAHAS